MRIRDIELCSTLVMGSQLPLVQHYIECMRIIFPNIPNKCPEKVPLHIGARNVTYSDVDSDNGVAFGQFKDLRVPLPNGLYQTIFQISIENDEKAFRLEYTKEMKARLNDETF